VSLQWPALDRHGLGDVRPVRPKTRIMIRKIAIRHTDKHNRPQGQTIYQINQCLFVALQ
jgi:hypothetical protein